MTTYAPPKQELRIPAPELRGAALALGSCTDREVCIEGSAGTGKTVGALFKIHVLLSRYPGARALQHGVIRFCDGDVSRQYLAWAS